LQYGLDELEQAERRLVGARERGLPGLLFNTMPKSASMFIGHSLSRSLDAPLVPIAITTATLRDHVVPRWAEALARGGAVCQEHLPADEHNLAALGRAGIAKVVVHVRDPRQATLSNLHHIANNFDEMVTIMRSPPPPDYRAWSISKRADWLLESYFPELVHWVEGWIAAQRDPGNGIEVLFTTYEDFHDDQSAVLRQIVDFHGIAPPELAAEGGVEKDRTTHFRRGRKDEWRETFSPAQQTAMWERMPRGLSERFGWRP
jgi:hypothetical protein